MREEEDLKILNSVEIKRVNGAWLYRDIQKHQWQVIIGNGEIEFTSGDYLTAYHWAIDKHQRTRIVSRLELESVLET